MPVLIQYSIEYVEVVYKKGSVARSFFSQAAISTGTF